MNFWYQSPTRAMAPGIARVATLEPPPCTTRYGLPSLPWFLKTMLFIGPMVIAASVVSAQSFPNKPIRIVTTGAGGGGDFVARLIGQSIAGPLGQPIVVDSRPSGVIPADIVAKAPPDGYTLLVTAGTLWILPLMQKTPYDPVKDFSPISLAVSVPVVLVVHPSVPANSVKELIALAKAKPGTLNYAADSIGGVAHLAAELFKSMAGVDLVRVNYSSGSNRLAASLRGEVQIQFMNQGLAAPHVSSGKLKVLALTSAEPSPLAPGVPTVAASGLPGYEIAGLVGMFAPAKTPAPVITRLNQEVVRFIKTAEAKEKFLGIGAETVGSSPEQFAAIIKADMARLGKVIKDAGIRTD